MASTQYGSKVTLYKAVPFDNSYQHSLRAMPFADKKAWLDANYNKVEKTNIMYPRLDTSTGKGTLRLEIIDSYAETYNYCCIEDDHFHKRFCFINGCRYINDAEVTNLHISSIYEFDLELDVVMTFLLSNDQYIPSVVERHHAGEYKFNNLKVAENVPYGEYIKKSIALCKEGLNSNDCWGVVVYSPKINEDAEYDAGFYMDNFMKIPNGAHFEIFDISQASSVASDLGTEIKSPSQIIAIYTIPKCMVNDFTALGITHTELTESLLRPTDIWAPYGGPGEYNPPKGVRLADYSLPKNKKTNYYPYNFGRLYDDCGGYVDVKFEDWEHGEIGLEYNVTLPVSIRATVKDYKGVDAVINPGTGVMIENLNYEKSVQITNYPLGSSTSDAYAAYIAQNGKTMNNQLAMNTTMSVGGMFATGIIGGIVGMTPVGLATAVGVGAFSAVKGLMDWANKQQTAADTADTTQGSTSNDSIEYRYGRKVFKMYNMAISPKFGSIVDNFFTKYGYAQGGLVETPDDSIRPYYTYIKTVTECLKPINGVSEPNNTQMTKLTTVFTNGITLWNNTVNKDTIFDYDNLDNGNY